MSESYQAPNLDPAPGQLLCDVTLGQLTYLWQSLTDQAIAGILRIETSHHLWNLAICPGGICLIDEEEHLVPTLIRKLKSLRLSFPELNKILTHPPTQLPASSQGDRLELYNLIQQIYRQDFKAVQQALKDIVQENLLAIYLEKSFNLIWEPSTDIAHLALPTLTLAPTATATLQNSQQWQKFGHIRHPYQHVQLLNTDDPIANVPLFASATKGNHRLSEIADRFRQDIYRTALKFDRLAEQRTVAILPLPPRPSSLKPRSPASSLTKVFVVDDSPVLLKQLGSLLEGWGYAVNISTDAANAVAKMLADRPNIIFLDINMPGLNGFELIKQIRRQPELNLTPLVLVTAENNVANNFRAKWANCRFLAKPKSLEETQEFRSQLRSLLRELAPLATDTLV